MTCSLVSPTSSTVVYELIDFEMVSTFHTKIDNSCEYCIEYYVIYNNNYTFTIIALFKPTTWFCGTYVKFLSILHIQSNDEIFYTILSVPRNIVFIYYEWNQLLKIML